MKNEMDTTENLEQKCAELEAEKANLETEKADMASRITELEHLVKAYEEQIRLAKQKQFGRSSEKSNSPGQLGMFDEAENEADKKKPEPTLEEITYTRKKQVGKREEDLSGLPVETIEYTLPEGQVCPECGEALHTMSMEIRRELTIIPAKVKITERVRHVYACRNCEQNNDHVPVIKAPMPEPVIRGSLASPSAVAQIMVEKYVKAVPLYRQEQALLREGIPLSRQTMANWMIRCSEDWLEPLYNRMKGLLLHEPVLHADETVLQVLQEPGKKANTNSYEWLYRTSGCAEHPIVLYEYQPTRSSSHPKRFLEGFSGHLHTDGYQGYHNLPNVTVIGCWAHVRRKFTDALKAAPEEARKGSASETGLDYCNRLFALERQYADLTPEERHKKRLEHSLPLAEEFLVWAKSFGALLKSFFRTALEYFIGQWPYLKNVFLDGRLELSNNRAERSIKPFVIGRKNWLFSNTPKGAKASSVIYSIIETAKENGLNPFEYLKMVFEELPNSPMSRLDELLPWSAGVPQRCKVGWV
jgi:transposase